MRVFGIDPGSVRIGYGCVESDGTRHRLLTCGAIQTPVRAPLADKLFAIHEALTQQIAQARPDCVAVENVFHAVNARSALVLGHARGVAILTAREAGLPVIEYTPAQVKRAVVGYGRADKPQVQRMVQLLLGLEATPSPHDVADALAVAICHLHRVASVAHVTADVPRGTPRSWRHYRPAAVRTPPRP